MNKKVISHGLMITAIVAFVFIAAALSSSKTYANTQTASAALNTENTADENTDLNDGVKMIGDNEIPLAATPIAPGLNIPLGILIMISAAAITSIVIYEDVKDEYSM